MAERQAHRLPTDVIPSRYQIRLTPDLGTWTFTGEESVAVSIERPVCEIIVNAAELSIQSVTLVDGAGKIHNGDVTLDPDNEQARFGFGIAAAPGPATLKIQFSGILNDKLHGFYRSTYKSADGRDRPLASTQFESTDARRAFPCWDEPAFKAVYQVRLVVDATLTAISNARVISESAIAGTGKKEVVFADSVKMSTYLVAFIVGDFEASEPVLVGAAPLRVWAVPGKRRLARFALDIGRASLEHFSAYYGIEYPGDKLDLIAIPDFASGAMENLGAITFRETALLVDTDKATRAELERVADVVAHENAHMWFGDLVTMRWWNGLWLNEAFATFMEMLAVDAWKPEWRRWDSFTVSRAAAMQVDGLKSSRPIEFPVDKPEEAAGMFDVLTYEKGASVLRMLEQYLGADAFRDGIRLYLRRHQYANTETGDLWNALEDSTGQPVRALMDSWIFQPGYPLVSVAQDGRSLRLSQQLFRYVQDGTDLARRWHVPVFLRVGSGGGVVDKTLLLTDKEQRVDFAADIDWAVVNAGGHGFYRARYSRELGSALTARLRAILSPVERFSLVNDAWATALAGMTKLTEYLELIELLRDEDDLNVWIAVIGSAHQLARIVEEDQRAGLATRLRDLFAAAVENFGWTAKPGENELASQLRGELIGALGTVAEDRPTQDRARELFTQYEMAPDQVERNLVPALVAIVSHCGGAAEYEKFVAKFRAAQTPQEETRYLFALANFADDRLVEHTLDITLNGAVRSQNAPYLMRSTLLNRQARRRAWTFFKARWDDMLRQFPDNSIPRMCEGVVGLVTEELVGDVEKFFSAHPVKQGTKQIEQHLERLRVALACQQRWRGLLRS